MPGTFITQATLASRLNLLLDGRKVLDLPADFPTIQAAVQARGASLSRPRWAYIRQANAAHRPRDTALLVALAEVFEVGEEYLTTEEAPIPLAVQRLLPQIRARREAAVREYAERLLGDVSPAKLADVERVLAVA